MILFLLVVLFMLVMTGVVDPVPWWVWVTGFILHFLGET